MKTKIPVWINILQVIILAILSFQTYACYFNPKLIYPEFVMDVSSAKMIWVCFISVETVPKVCTNDQIFSTKPSGRSFCQM